MGIASVSPPGTDGKPAGKMVFGDAAADIGKAGSLPVGVDRRIAAVAAATTIVQDNRGTSRPVARSKTETASLHQARAIGG
jgi:hypothetical protein